MSTVQIVGLISVLFCAAATAFKMIRIARMPVHLRWDLYPIPHEKGRGAYGGSYYEEIDWWTRPRTFSLAAELRAMALEIFFVHSLFRNNRPLWLVSFPFHIGLYCLVVFTLLLFVGSLLELAGVGIGAVLQYLTLAFGAAGWVLTAAGAVGLVLSRLFRGELRRTSMRGDYLNLALLAAVSVAGFVAWISADPDYTVLRRLIAATLTFDSAGDIPTGVVVEVGLTSVLLIYFPFTHMTHMFSKFFTYHSVRWEDHPNIRGGRIEKAVTEALGRPLTWAAPHILTGSWADAAADRKKTDDE